ncbi:MAG: hypothetical protein Q9164_007105 [Protoblastenia rupestris]
MVNKTKIEGPLPFSILASYGLLSSDMLIFHANDASVSDIALAENCHIHLYSTHRQNLTFLQTERARRDAPISEQGKCLKNDTVTVKQVFNFGTIRGTRAIGMEDVIGSLAVGKINDALVFDGLCSGILCAAQQDLVAAILMHASAWNVELVIVDGVIREEAGKLKAVSADPQVVGLVSGAEEVGVGREQVALCFGE